MNVPWIGVDLDGTLATYEGWQGPQLIGEPIPAMVERVKRWLTEGKVVKIVTARVSSQAAPFDALLARQAIHAWTTQVFGYPLPVTAEKDFGMLELWDDRARQVKTNTGEEVAVLLAIKAITE